MAVFDRADFDGHALVVHAADAATGLRAIIAVHDLTRGPALGGCRMWAYPSAADAERDALRLSRGMTYKAALADLPLGGGKSVIIGDAGRDKTPALMRAMGRAVDALGGRYIVAEDVGMTVADMGEMRRTTRYVSGLSPQQGGSGDPSGATARGVFVGLRAALAHRGREVGGSVVAVQGLGHVGMALCRLLADHGARLIVADTRPEAVTRAVEAFDAVAMAPDTILEAEADVFAPCALGAVIDDDTLPRLKAGIIAGSANNQLAEDRHGEALRRRGILYAPDYAINAGGLMRVAAEWLGTDDGAVAARVEGIARTMTDIYEASDRQELPTNIVADRLAEARLKPGGTLHRLAG
ncbi:MAG: Glu/Leu/Phe/Val family dehydrogenase [Inquilinaceae bacterium]